MDQSVIAAELRPAASRLPRVRIEQPAALRLARVGARFRPRPGAEGTRVTDIRTSGLRLRVYEPGTRAGSGALLWFHGGGFVMGDLLGDQWLTAPTAAELGITVVSVNYSLAPEHPFPAALREASAAWRWLQRRSTALQIDPARIVVGGESAGGGLAASLVQHLADGDGPQPLGQWLLCPMLDDRTATQREPDVDRHVGWDNEQNRFAWGAYLGCEPGSEMVPDGAVPARRENVAGLPPAFIGVGDIDLFHDEDVAYARRLRDAGVSVTLDIVPGGPHGFENWAPAASISRAFVHRARRWLGDCLAGPVP